MPIINWDKIDKKSKKLYLHVKHDKQLVELEELYPRKIKNIRMAFSAEAGVGQSLWPEEKVFLEEKIARLADKYKGVKDEIAGRKENKFTRKPIGTSYYIDLDNGNDGNDGLSKDNPWLTLEKYTTVTVRSPGDIAYVRAGTTETKTDTNLQLDEDGHVLNSRIEIIGCDSVTNDPWNDGSDVLPILSFGDSNYCIYASVDGYWKMQRMSVIESNSNYANLYLSDCCMWYLLNCEFRDQNRSGGSGLFQNGSYGLVIEDSMFHSNKGYNFKCVGSGAKIIKSTFNGGTATTNYGVFAEESSQVEIIDSDFDQDTVHDNEAVYAGVEAEIYLRNCKRVKGIKTLFGGMVCEEDANGVYGDYKFWYSVTGIITKDTSIKTGNADFSLKVESRSACTPIACLDLSGVKLIRSPFNILCIAGVEKTITVKIRSLGVWSTYPTNEELYLEFSYLSNGASAARTKIASTQVLSDETTWISFTVTFTPLQTGIAYGNVYLKKYENSKGCYVNMEAT